VEGHPIRILIADDHEILRLGLRAILEARSGWKVVAEAADGQEAIAQALASKPDVVIMDYWMPIMNGLEATRQIRACLPKTEIMIFTVHDSDMLVRDLLQAGARAYVLKSNAKRHLIAAVESLANHKPSSPVASRNICLMLVWRRTGAEAEEARSLRANG
jgi:DNA-binding NarL/FixJ family response regulator